MTPQQAKRKYKNKRNNAERRGIPFTLTFKEWVDAWGDQSPDGSLQLQRKDKALGFVPGNVEVGERPRGMQCT